MLINKFEECIHVADQSLADKQKLILIVLIISFDDSIILVIKTGVFFDEK